MDNTIAARKQTWAQEADRLRAAATVAVVGGGPVGVELAGEVRQRVCVYIYIYIYIYI
jgi:NADH dehydrogenase FAD-containing subunit